MRTLTGAAAILALLAVPACRRTTEPNPAHPLPPDHTAQVQAWRDKHEADYRRDWASIAGLYP